MEKVKCKYLGYARAFDGRWGDCCHEDADAETGYHIVCHLKYQEQCPDFEAEGE
jgi:hypothetical protein